MYQEAAPSLVNVNWRAVVIVGNSKTIYARATQISKNALTLLLPLQLAMHIPIRVLLEIPNNQNGDKQYLDCNGQSTHAILVGASGEYRTGFRIENISNEHRSILDKYLKQKF